MRIVTAATIVFRASVALALFEAAASADDAYSPDERADCQAARVRYQAAGYAPASLPQLERLCLDNLHARNAALKTAMDAAAADNARAAARRERERAITAAAEQRQLERETQASEGEARLTDPRWAGPLLSAQLCRATHERAATMAELAKEKRLARQAGVVDLERMREYQNTLRDDDEEFLAARRALATLKLKPIRCAKAQVAAIESCLGSYAPNLGEDRLDESCRAEGVIEYLRLTRAQTGL